MARPVPSLVPLLFPCLLTLLCCIPSTAAFGAGTILKSSALKDSFWRHGDIAEVMFNLGLEELTVRRIYFGNWLCDFNQAIDRATLARIPRPIIQAMVSLLAYLEFGFTTKEFEVTSERLGVYRPEIHIDNPKGYPDDASNFEPRLRGPVHVSELGINRQTGMKNYIAGYDGTEPYDTTKKTVGAILRDAILLGRGEEEQRHDGLRLLGVVLHALEDFLAHSNYLELCIAKITGRDIFLYVGDAATIDMDSEHEAATSTQGSHDPSRSHMQEVHGSHDPNMSQMSHAMQPPLQQSMHPASTGQSLASQQIAQESALNEPNELPGLPIHQPPIQRDPPETAPRKPAADQPTSSQHIPREPASTETTQDQQTSVAHQQGDDGNEDRQAPSRSLPQPTTTAETQQNPDIQRVRQSAYSGETRHENVDHSLTHDRDVGDMGPQTEAMTVPARAEPGSAAAPASEADSSIGQAMTSDQAIPYQRPQPSSTVQSGRANTANITAPPHHLAPESGTSGRSGIPPLVTGTFGPIDFLETITGMASDHAAARNMSDFSMRLPQSHAIDSAVSAFFIPLKAILALPGFGLKDLDLSDIIKASKDESDHPRSWGDWEKAPHDFFQTIQPILILRDKIAREVLHQLEKIPLLRRFLADVSAALDRLVFALLAPFLKPILRHVQDTLIAVSGELTKAQVEMRDQLFAPDSTFTDPTHSLLSKDHFSHVLNPVAGFVSSYLTEQVVKSYFAATTDPTIDPIAVVDNAMSVLHHPYITHNQTPLQQEMYIYVQQWWSAHGPTHQEELLHALSKPGILNQAHHNLVDPHHPRDLSKASQHEPSGQRLYLGGHEIPGSNADTPNPVDAAISAAMKSAGTGLVDAIKLLTIGKDGDESVPLGGLGPIEGMGNLLKDGLGVLGVGDAQKGGIQEGDEARAKGKKDSKMGKLMEGMGKLLKNENLMQDGSRRRAEKGAYDVS